MKFLFAFLASAIVITSCNNSGNSTTASTDTTVSNEGYARQDSTEIRKTITEFYDWYKVNWPKFPNTGLYESFKIPDLPPYRINWKEVEKYHQFIKDSVPQLGNAFIEEQKRFFAQCDSAFKIDIEDEIPYGFDYDWYTNSQEDPNYLIDEMKNSHNWKTKITGDEATVEVMRWRDVNGNETEESIIKFGMKREAGKWTIARIGSPY